MSRQTVSIALGFVALAAYYHTAGLSLKNGYLQLLGEQVGSGKLSDGSRISLSWSGVDFIDEFLAVPVHSFWPIVSGESLRFSVLGGYLASQLLALFTFVWIESARSGHADSVLKFAFFWGVFWHSVPVAIVAPVYYLAYIWLSPFAVFTRRTSPNVVLPAAAIDVAKLTAMPLALIVTCLIPAAVLIFGRYDRSSAQLQATLASWMIYPVTMAVFMLLFTRIAQFAFEIPPMALQTLKDRRLGVRTIYTFVLCIASLVHLGTFIFVSSKEFRDSFNMDIDFPFNLKDIFVPAMTAAQPQLVSSAAEGLMLTIQYNYIFLSIASIVFVLYMGGLTSDNITHLLSGFVIYGPAGSVLFYLQDRDEMMWKALQAPAPAAEKKAA